MNVCGRPGEAYVVWGPSRLKCKEIAAPSAGEETVEEKEGEKKKEEKFETSRQKDESRLFGGGLLPTWVTTVCIHGTVRCFG